MDPETTEYSNVYNNTTNQNILSDLDIQAFKGSGWFLSAYYIGLVYPMLICLVGLPCNIANIIIITRKWTLSPPVLYIAVLSFVDSMAIVHKLLMIHLPTVGFPVSSHGCQYLKFVLQTTTHMSSWTLVLLTIERAMVVKCPFSRRTICSIHRAAISIDVTAIALIVYNFHWTFTVTANEGNKNCIGHKDFRYFIFNIWEYVDALSFTFLPSACLVISNSIIVVCLRSRMKQMRNRYVYRQIQTNLIDDGEIDTKKPLTDQSNLDYEPYQHSQVQRLLSRQFRQITRSTIMASVAFIALTMPYSITMTSLKNTSYTFYSTGHAKILLLTTSVYALRDVMHVSNFFLYVLPHWRVFDQCKRRLQSANRHPRANDRSALRNLSRKMTISLQLSNNSNRAGT